MSSQGDHQAMWIPRGFMWSVLILHFFTYVQLARHQGVCTRAIFNDPVGNFRQPDQRFNYVVQEVLHSYIRFYAIQEGSPINLPHFLFHYVRIYLPSFPRQILLGNHTSLGFLRVHVSLNHTRATITRRLLGHRGVRVTNLMRRHDYYVPRLVNQGTLRPYHLRNAYRRLFRTTIQSAIFRTTNRGGNLFLKIRAFRHIPLFRVRLRHFSTNVVRMSRTLLITFTRRPSLPLFRIGITGIRPSRFYRARPTIRGRRSRTMVPFQRVTLVLNTFRRLRELLHHRVFKRGFVLLKQFSKDHQILQGTISLVSRVIVGPVRTNRPPNNKKLFISTFAIRGVRVFMSVLFYRTTPRYNIRPFKISFFRFHVLYRGTPTTLRGTTRTTRVTMVTRHYIHTFTYGRFRVARVLRGIHQDVLRQFILTKVLFVGVSKRVISLSFPLGTIIFRDVSHVQSVDHPCRLRAQVVHQIRVHGTILQRSNAFGASPFHLPRALFRVKRATRLTTRASFASNSRFITSQTIRRQ